MINKPLYPYPLSISKKIIFLMNGKKSSYYLVGRITYDGGEVFEVIAVSKNHTHKLSFDELKKWRSEGKWQLKREESYQAYLIAHKYLVLL